MCPFSPLALRGQVDTLPRLRNDYFRMRYFLPAFGTAGCLPHLEGNWRWLILGVFMGFVCLMLREVSR